VKKKTLLTTAFTLTLLFSAVAGIQYVNLANANPYNPIWLGQRSPPASVQPPVISILSPKNNSIIIANNVLLSINVSLGEGNDDAKVRLREVNYKGDWELNKTYVEIISSPNPFLFQLNLTVFQKETISSQSTRQNRVALQLKCTLSTT
jgi:hypothetical protein